MSTSTSGSISSITNFQDAQDLASSHDLTFQQVEKGASVNDALNVQTNNSTVSILVQTDSAAISALEKAFGHTTSASAQIS